MDQKRGHPAPSGLLTGWLGASSIRWMVKATMAVRRAGAQLMRKGLTATALLAMTLLAAGPAAAATPPSATVVEHDYTFTEHFDDDICGPRANTTTFTRKMQQVQFTQRADGTWAFRYVAAVTYVSDYDDPALPTLTGSVTEVEHYMFTPGETFVVTNTFRDFYGDIRILTRYHVTIVDGVVKVETFHDSVVGCP
jgi:hypothetical protein